MKIAILTGASSGMGREFARQICAWESFDEVWVIARRQARLEELRTEVPCPVRPVVLDLTDSASFSQYSALLAEQSPEVRLLVNCAGFGRFGSYADIPVSDSAKMIDLNCKALVYMTELTLPYMQEGARIVQLDSLSAFQPTPWLNVYAATKAFVLSYARGLNQELRPRGIRVMAVSPGWVKTEFFDHACRTDPEAVTYYNIMYEPKDVVQTALHDLYRTKKDVSIHGAPVRRQVRMVKLFPHSLVMKVWLRQQKHDGTR